MNPLINSGAKVVIILKSAILYLKKSQNLQLS